MPARMRKAEKQDGGQVLELVKVVLSDYELAIEPEGIDKDLSDLDKYYFQNNGWFAVLVDEANKVVGSYGIYRISDAICELRKMYVLPHYQGQGLGKMMLEDALRRAKDLGYTEMILDSHNRLDKAIRLYKSYGFEEYTREHMSDRCNYAMEKYL